MPGLRTPRAPPARGTARTAAPARRRTARRSAGRRARPSRAPSRRSSAARPRDPYWSSMSAGRLRALLIGLIVVAAVISYVGNRENSHVLNGLGLGVFLVAVLLYGLWRRAVR